MTIARNGGKIEENRESREKKYRSVEIHGSRYEFSHDAVDFTLGVYNDVLTTEKLKAKELLPQAIYLFITLEIHVNYMRNAIMSVKRLIKHYAFHLGQGLLARFKIRVETFSLYQRHYVLTMISALERSSGVEADSFDRSKEMRRINREKERNEMEATEVTEYGTDK